LVKPEYNHSTSPALLNALEHAYHEWHDKAVAFAGYDTDGPETAAPTAHSPTVRCRGTDQPRHHCRRRHRSTDQRHHCCGQRHHRRRGRSRVGLRVQWVVGRFAAGPDHDQTGHCSVATNPPT